MRSSITLLKAVTATKRQAHKQTLENNTVFIQHMKYSRHSPWRQSIHRDVLANALHLGEGSLDEVP